MHTLLLLLLLLLLLVLLLLSLLRPQYCAACCMLHVFCCPSGQLQQVAKQKPEGFWQTASKQINVRR